ANRHWPCPPLAPCRVNRSSRLPTLITYNPAKHASTPSKPARSSWSGPQGWQVRAKARTFHRSLFTLNSMIEQLIATLMSLDDQALAPAAITSSTVCSDRPSPTYDYRLLLLGYQPRRPRPSRLRCHAERINGPSTTAFPPPRKGLPLCHDVRIVLGTDHLSLITTKRGGERDGHNQWRQRGPHVRGGIVPRGGQVAPEC